MTLIKLIISITLIVASHNAFAQSYNLKLLTSTDSVLTNSDSSDIQKISVPHTHTVFFAYGFLPAQEKTGVLYTGYMYGLFKKMSLEASFCLYTNDRYSVNAITYFHTYLRQNSFDVYLGGGLQFRKIKDEKKIYPIISIKGDVNISSHFALGISLLQPFFESTSAYFIPGVGFILLNAGYKF